ncbi:PASTA domain-containing protein [Propionibacterium cyclohexanicum]|nr:PASTA domain-containing protein [Propionibacterium cyclohexanicum]
MERRVSQPARPATSRWRPVGGQPPVRTPLSPVDIRVARPSRNGTRPGPTSQRTPRFPVISNDRVHRRRRSVVGVLLVLLLATIAGFGSWWLTAGRFVTAPAVIGLSEPQALEAAQQAGVKISFEQQHSASVPAGIVIGTEPAAGARVGRGSQLHARLSVGPQTFPMPTVVGLDKDSAIKALTGAQLSVGSVDEQFDATHPVGTVTGASAKPGTQVAGGTAVNLTVSKGPAPVTVNDYTGQPADSAKAELGASGLNVALVERTSDSVPAGQVISQTPASGQLPPGSTVSLVVSSGPQLISVPDVRARSTADAQDILQKAGFTVQVVTVDPDAIIHLGRVQRTDPGRDAKAPKGSTVSIYII